MASLVNKTYFHSSAGSTSPTVTLSAPSTIGNWLILYIAADFPRQWTLTTDQGETFSNVGVTTSGGSFGGFWLCRTTKVASSVSFTSTHIGSNDTYYAAIFEVSGTGLQYVNQGGVNGGVSNSTHAFETSAIATNVTLTPMAGPASGTTLYFSGCTASIAATTTFTVSGGWAAALDQANNNVVGGSSQQAGSAYLSASGNQQPTFTRGSTSSTLDASGIFIQDSAAPALIPTATTILSSPDPSATGVDVVFSATVSGAGTPSPSGTITFFIGGPGYGRSVGYGLDPYGDPALIVAVTSAMPNGAGSATAQFQTTSLAVGSYFAYAVYSGDTVYATSTSPEILQVVIAAQPTTVQQYEKDFGNSTADVIWWHTGFTGYDEETLANEGLINTGGTPNIPWLLGLSVSMGNGMTEALARSNILYFEAEYSDEGGGGGNESGASQGGAQSGGLLVSW